MSPLTRWTVPVVAALLGCGCQTAVRSRPPVPADDAGDDAGVAERPAAVEPQPAAPAPVAPGADLANSFETSDSPLAAATAARDVFRHLGFRGNTHGLGGELVRRGDVFSAKVDAITAEDHPITVECHWLAEGRTRVEVRSDLPADQHRFVTGKLREAVNPPTSQPTG